LGKFVYRILKTGYIICDGIYSEKKSWQGNQLIMDYDGAATQGRMYDVARCHRITVRSWKLRTTS